MWFSLQAATRVSIAAKSGAVFSRASKRFITNNGFLRVSEEVKEALVAKKPVVALETTIYTHGYPYPENVALASHLENIVRTNGGIPATIGIIDGVARVGMGSEEISQLTESAGKLSTLKLSRRDLSYVCGLRLTGRNFHGGTTIAGTMLLAHLVGIRVFGTGGLGGVHRGAESSMDISADLTELGRTPVAVISSGCKSFLDIPRTLEYLETEGVYVGTFSDGRHGNVDFPAFWSRDSGVRSPTTISSEIDAAAIIHAQRSLSISSGMLFANPVPADAAVPQNEMETVIKEAIRQADISKITGKDNTPFILAKIKELSHGKSIVANKSLIESNVRKATIIARELSVLEAQQGTVAGRNKDLRAIVTSHATLSQARPAARGPFDSVTQASRATDAKLRPEIVVAGALAVDFACDFAPLDKTANGFSPQLQTSNPAAISQTLGGVAHNIAESAHLLGVSVQLHSVVGDDLSGRAALDRLGQKGMSNEGIQVLGSPARTAQYVAINNVNKDLVLAMADMKILEIVPMDIRTKLLNKVWISPPKVLALDANWDTETLHQYLDCGRSLLGTVTIFEPVSTAKAVRIFTCPAGNNISMVPQPLVDVITPNELELRALHDQAHHLGHFEHPEWFSVIDALGIPSTGLRVPLAITTSPALVDAGVPQQAIKLLPFFPTILTKLGPQGVLLTQLLCKEDVTLSSADEAEYVLSRCKNGDANVGGLYVRLFPTEVLNEGDVVSVNGIGDTFVGAVTAGLALGKRVQDIIPLAQRAAAMSLMSTDSVSKQVKLLKRELEKL